MIDAQLYRRVKIIRTMASETHFILFLCCSSFSYWNTDWEFLVITTSYVNWQSYMEIKYLSCFIKTEYQKNCPDLEFPRLCFCRSYLHNMPDMLSCHWYFWVIHFWLHLHGKISSFFCAYRKRDRHIHLSFSTTMSISYNKILNL